MNNPTEKEAASKLRSLFRVVPFDEGFAAYVGKRPVGHMKLRPSLDRTGVAQIKDVELDPKYRGMGLGRKLYGEVMRRLPEGKLESGASVSQDAQGVWKKLQSNPSYTVTQNPGSRVQVDGLGKEEVLLTREHSINQMDRRAEGLPRLPDSIYSAAITPKALIKKAAIEGVKVQRKDQEFLDEHFGVSPKWDDFHKKLKNKSFVTAVQADTRSDDKLKAFVSAVSMRDQAKGPSVKAPSDVSGNYKVRYHPEHDRFSCTCPDWTFKRSVSGADCKHISRIKDASKESLMSKTKKANVTAADVLFRVGRAVNQEKKNLNTAAALKAENQVYREAYPQQSFVQAFLKKAEYDEMAKKITQAARRMLNP